MKKLLLLIPLMLVATLVLLLTVHSVNPEGKGETGYYHSYKHDYRIYSPPVPSRVDFCGEEAPLSVYYVSEKLEREILVNTYWHSNTLLMFKRAHRWFPVIEPILRQNAIPDDFKYLALIESGFQNITSPSGAKGFWQLLKTTGREYGLEVNRQVDERNHVEKATLAACKYLQDSYRRFGNWTMVAASYNMGMAGVEKEMQRQHTRNYYELALNSETSRYVYRILAVKTIFASPRKYGFLLRQRDLYPPLTYHVAVVDSTIDSLGLFARRHHCTYRMLKELNPWLLTYYLPNTSRKKYEIKLPDTALLNYKVMKGKLKDELGIFGDIVPQVNNK